MTAGAGPAGFDWGTAVTGASLPSQGLYAIVPEAAGGEVLMPAGGSPAYGNTLTTGSGTGDPAQTWVIRALSDGSWYLVNGKNAYLEDSPKPAVGLDTARTKAVITACVKGTSQSAALHWLLTANSDGTFGIRSQSTGQYLTLTGAGASSVLKAANGSTSQKFRLYSLKTHDYRYVLNNTTAAVNPGENTLLIDNLNDPTLPQNDPAVIADGRYVTAGSGVSVSIREGFANKSNWSLASDGSSLLPAYYIAMPSSSRGSAEEYVEITYPRVGTWFDGVTTHAVGARLRFSDIRPSDPLMQNFDRASSPTADGCKYLVISSNLFSGYWYNNIAAMDMKLTFFRCDTGEDVVPAGAYLTFNSLSSQQCTENLGTGRDIGLPSSDAFGEFVGIRDKTVTGYVYGPPGNASSPADAAVTNVLGMDLTIWSPYTDETGNYGTQSVFIGQTKYQAGTSASKQAPWTDVLGGARFSRNSVMLMLEQERPDTTFIVGSLKGEGWNSLSAAPLYARVEEPVKTVEAVEGSGALIRDGTGLIPCEGGRVTFRIEQKLPQIGFDLTEAPASLSVEDTLPAGLTAVSAEAEDPSAWSVSLEGRTMTAVYTGDYREKLDDHEEEARGVFLIRAVINEEAVLGETLRNTATVRWTMTGYDDKSKTSLPAEVIPIVTQLPDTGIHILNAGGDGGSPTVLIGLLLAASAAAAAVCVRLIRLRREQLCQRSGGDNA